MAYDFENTQNNKEIPTKEARALQCVKDFMSLSKRYTRPFFDKFVKLFQSYYGAKLFRTNPLQRADLRPPYTFTIVETYTPFFIEAFLSDKPYIAVDGREDSDTQYEEPLENYLAFQLDQMCFEETFTCFIKDYILYGTAIGKLIWKLEKKWVKKKDLEEEEQENNPLLPELPGGLPLELSQIINPQMQNNQYENEEIEEESGEEEGEEKNYNEWVEIIEKDQPEFENVNIFDFFPDWTASKPGDIQSMRACVHRVYRSMDQLRAKERKKLPDGSYTGIYTNLDMLELNLQNTNNDSNNTGYSTVSDIIKQQASDGEVSLKNKNKIEIWEYWGKFDPEANGKNIEYVITVANGETVIRCDVNPLRGQYKPFIGAVNYQVPNEFYGLGEIEPVWSLIKEATALRNARLDQANQAVNRMWLVDRNANINLRSVYTRAGGVILTNDINGIKAMEPAEVMASSFREVSEIDFGIQQAVALPNPSSGVGKVAPGYSRTAAGVNFLQSFTNSRLSLKIRLLSTQFMNKLGQMLLMMNKQFLNGNTYIRVSNESNNIFMEIPYEAFLKKYDFSTSSAVDRMTRKDRQQNLYQNIIPLMDKGEQAMPGLINWAQFIPDTLKDFDYRNTDKYIVPEEQRQQQQQAQQQMQIQMQQMNAQMNAQSQAQAQSQLILLKNQGKIEEKQIQAESDLKRDLVKGVMKAAEGSGE